MGCLQELKPTGAAQLFHEVLLKYKQCCRAFAMDACWPFPTHQPPVLIPLLPHPPDIASREEQQQRPIVNKVAPLQSIMLISAVIFPT